MTKCKMKNLIYAMMMLFLCSYASADCDVYFGQLDIPLAEVIESGKTYCLNESVTSESNDYLINLDEDNVVIDCQGFEINTGGEDGGGITVNDLTNSTIKNCIINVYGSSNEGIFLEDGSSYNNVIDTRITSTVTGLRTEIASYNYFSNVTIISSNTGYYTTNAVIFFESDFNFINGLNIIINTTNNENTALYMTNSNNNLIYNSILITLDNVGIYVNGENNTFLNNNITSSFLWINSTGTNFFNNSDSGNIYYLANGTPSWKIFNITTTTPPGWATDGAALPFGEINTPEYWSGTGDDYHPFVGFESEPEPIISPVIPKFWFDLKSPVNGNKYANNALTLLVETTNYSMNFNNCSFNIDDYVSEPCTFNVSQNFTAVFGWNDFEVCASNASVSHCEKYLFWADKTNKTASDYFPFIIVLCFAMFLSAYGIVSLGIAGIIGGVLFFAAGVMSFAFFHWILAVSLMIIGAFTMWGVLNK